ncbi:MAG: hypothetical protein ABL876_18285, partial [Chitinophagaceae bacterium]
VYKRQIVRRLIGRKLAVLFLLTVSAAAFATLGDGNKNSDKPKKSLLSNRTSNNSFSLRSGYTFRSNNIISNNTQAERRYIRINTVVTMQKGSTSYVVPLKKKAGITNVKIDIGNRQFQRN